MSSLGLSTRHIDTAEYYKNEIEVGRAVRESGIPREDIFISELSLRVRGVGYTSSD